MANTDSTNTVDAKAVKRVAFVIDSGRLSTESSEQFAERLLEAAAPKPAWPSLEAVWPEPTFTPEEIEILLDVMDEASYKDGRRDLCVKLEAMRDATS